MEQNERYWRWARRVAVRGGAGGVLEAGAVLRVLGTPEELTDRLEDLEGTTEAALAFETPRPLEREGLVSIGALSGLHNRLARAVSRVEAAETWLAARNVYYDADDDALKLHTGRRPRRIVSIAACQVWLLFREQARGGHSVYDGLDVDPATVQEPTVLARVRWALEPRFPAHLLPKIPDAIKNHGPKHAEGDGPRLTLRSLPGI